MSAVPRYEPTVPVQATPILGQSEIMRQVIERVQRFARTGLPILLVGETGTGKDLLARHIHSTSGRPGELIDVNCGALPRDMVESLLFGHRRGAFTGAVSDMPGLVSKAAGGTLFLDELCSLSSEAQVKLLRVLETGHVRPLGDTRNVAVEFRVIAAVQEEFGARLRTGAFREDLYHRIAGAVVHLPPLCERSGDVAILAAHFAARHARVLGTGAVAVLEAYRWPGNVRELRMVLDRAALLTDRGELDASAIAEALGQGALHVPRKGGEAQAGASSRMALLAACSANDWDPGRISTALGVSRATLYRRLRKEKISLRISGRRNRTGPSLKSQ
jgi:transcriptional regulator with PAS, ATPase and Fis domain